MRYLFKNRQEAGERLAQKLLETGYREPAFVFGLPRGGVIVASEVAQRLRLPLHAFVVRKLGVPGREALAFGAIASGGGVILNEDIIEMVGLTQEDMNRIHEREQQELKRREAVYDERDLPQRLEGSAVYLIDDGLATGASMLAGIQAVRLMRPDRIIVAVPLAAAATYRKLKTEVEEIVCLATPSPFYSVGAWYQDFAEVTDQEVSTLLRRARSRSQSTRRERLPEPA